MISDNKAKFRLYVEGYGTVTNCDWFVSGTVRSTKKRAAEDLKQLKAQLAEAKQVKEQITTITRQRDLAVEALKSCGVNDGLNGPTQYFDEDLVERAIKESEVKE